MSLTFKKEWLNQLRNPRSRKRRRVTEKVESDEEEEFVPTKRGRKAQKKAKPKAKKAGWSNKELRDLRESLLVAYFHSFHVTYYLKVLGVRPWKTLAEHANIQRPIPHVRDAIFSFLRVCISNGS